jgi:hypothetical protein
MTGKTFVKITNEQIYKEIKEHNVKVDSVCDSLCERVVKIEQKIPFIQKLVFGAYGFCMGVLGFFISHLLG